MGRTILHVDMDAFYAAVEQRDNPKLQGRPLIVGADPKNGKGRGIVATCSYEARRFGVHSAQPISQAWHLCPQGVYLPPDMAKYAQVSECIMATLFEFTDLVEQISIDEAFLDVTGSQRLLGEGSEIAKKIKARICQDQRLTASVGVASNKFVAKVASDLKKPDGLVVVQSGKEKEFLQSLPVSRLWGVGPKTAVFLAKMGIERIGQLAQLSHLEMVSRLGEGGEHLWQLAQGIDDRPVSTERGYQSIGHETTFEVDTADAKVLHNTLLKLAEMVAQRLRSNQVKSRTITIKFREADFTTFTRRATLATPADTAEKIFPVALRLMRSLLRRGKRVRLIGVYASNLVGRRGEAQLSLFVRGRQKDRELAAAVDDITRRYGNRAITRAALVAPSTTKSQDRKDKGEDLGKGASPLKSRRTTDH